MFTLKRLILPTLALTAFAVALFIDRPIAIWVHSQNLSLTIRSSPVAKAIKWPGDFRFTLALAALIVALDRKRWRIAPALAIAGIIAGLLYTCVKWSVGRTRPFPRNAPQIPPFEFHPFQLGVEGLWKANNQAFPSGHACLAFATAAVLARFFPGGRFAFYVAASIVGAERILEGAHYPADVVGGAIFGILSAWAAMRILHRLFPDRVESQGFPVRTLSEPEGKRISHE